MATAGSNLTEDQFLCSICLDVFTQPVSLPCGHNFCKACITDCWNSTYSGLCQCPMCKEKFNRRHELNVNCFISEMADHFRKSVQVTDAQEREANVPWEILCDLCIDPKIKAVKSCLVCLTSYCETHLEPHHRVANLKTHQLVEPLGSMESRKCKKHNKILELFCRKEKRCICMLCSQTDHRSHNVVAMEDESGKRKEEMRKTKKECEQKIQERERKLQEIRRSAEVNKEVAEKETADGVEVLTALVASIQERLAEIFEVIDRKQREIQQTAELSITELQQEITELQMTCMECEQLSQSQDHLKILMYNPTSPSTSAPCSDWSKVLMDNKLSAGTVRAAVAKMEKTLIDGMEALMKQMEEHSQATPSANSSPQPCSSLQQSAPKPPSIKPSSAKPLAPKPPVPKSLSQSQRERDTSGKRFSALAKSLSQRDHQVTPRVEAPRPHSSPLHPAVLLPHTAPSFQQIVVICDGCGCDISSTYWYDCTICPDYCLCPACLSTGYHMEHILFFKQMFGIEPYISRY